MRSQPPSSLVPLWLKVSWTVWVLIWAPIYFRQYGAHNFLFYCDLGNIFIGAALWLESALIFSWQAVGLLLFQSLYAVDLIVALLSGWHPFGGTEYMFDPKIPVIVRALGLYHIVVPPLLLWAVRRLGYDGKGLLYQTLTLWVLLPINFLWRPQYNVNWARGLGHEQHLVPSWLYLASYLVVVPVVVYWPTHVLLARWAGSKARRVPGC
jgi:hypothetical protein